MAPLIHRPRRLRQSTALRQLVREESLAVTDCVLPLFIKENQSNKQAILSMPGHFQLGLDDLDSEIAQIEALKIPAVLLFGIPAEKDATGSSSLRQDGIVQRAIKKIKSLAPRLLVIADLCFCEYTDHGHCGVLHQRVDGQFDVDNDATLPLLVNQALSLVEAGADIIAPSGMMDGMVAALRHGLDQAGFVGTPIMSYAVKYASAFYGPFREAAEGAPQHGDRRSYQMDPANAHRALREAELDIAQGADFLIVKPAQNYLDIIYRIKSAFPFMPVVAYQVSGEFAMIKAAAANGWMDEQQAIEESLLAIKRAGADIIITYFAKTFAQMYV